jgi:hypothetical protein
LVDFKHKEKWVICSVCIEEFHTEFAQGSAGDRRGDFGPTPGLTSLKKQRCALCKKRSNKHREQTNIKQINRLVRHQRHHPVALDAHRAELIALAIDTVRTATTRAKARAALSHKQVAQTRALKRLNF